ncbi:MAG: dienelactone hydrolase family protein [Alphaproteobacteria bacterium]
MHKPSIPRAVIDLYDAYTHVPLPRRVFLDRLALLMGSTAAAAALLPLLENNYAHAEMVPEDDPALAVETAQAGALSVYVAKPAGVTVPLPAIVVIHENRGLNPHIKDVARRAALAGYIAIAPDYLSADGTPTPADEDQARDEIGALDPAQTLENGLAVLQYARAGREDVDGRVGVVGFCWGGAQVNSLAVNDPDLDAAVAFYGRQPASDDAAKIQAALMLHYAENDEGVNAGIEAYTQALGAAGIPFEMHMYEGAEHAFHNDTNAARYDEAAAALAWQRTMMFFDQHLKSDEG